MVDDELSLDAFEVFVVAGCHSRYRIALTPFQKRDAYCMTHVFEDLNGVVGRPHIFVEPRILVSYFWLGLNLVLVTVPFLSQRVDPSPRLVMALQSVAIHQACSSIYTHSTTSFPAQAATSIFSRHEFLCKTAFLKVKIERVQTDELGKQHVLGLLLALQVVAEDEAPFLAGVAVQINVYL